MMLPDQARARLLSLADDCEERAHWPSCGAYPRGLFHRTANDARVSARTLRGDELHMALQAAMAAARFAACLNGETVDYPTQEAIAKPGAPGMALAPLPLDLGAQSARNGPTLNARQLAALSGMSERGALKRIVHGFYRGLRGFYREGRRWFAEREAFDAFRMSSD
jgi:hypothetical protein